MSKHDHKHEHCKHAEVKYCQHCDVVYCRACGHEWNDRPKGGWWYPTTWYPATWYPTTVGDSTVNPGAIITTTGYADVTDGNAQPVVAHIHD